MTTDTGRVGVAETGSHAAHEAPSGLRPSGFDPARLSKLPAVEPWLASEQGVEFDELHSLWWEGLIVATFPEATARTSGRQHWKLTSRGKAKAMEARQGRGARRLDPKDDSAGPQDIAQNGSLND